MISQGMATWSKLSHKLLKYSMAERQIYFVLHCLRIKPSLLVPRPLCLVSNLALLIYLCSTRLKGDFSCVRLVYRRPAMNSKLGRVHSDMCV